MINVYAYMALDLLWQLQQIQDFTVAPWNRPADKQFDKCSEKSKCKLQSGDEMFNKKSYEHAVEFYNASLCYAPAGSESIPLAYGNRSAVYCEMGKYALAIENIKLARENGYPAEKMAELDAYEEKCKKLMEVFGPDKNFDASSFFKLSHQPNEKIPFIAGCLELRKNVKYGRHIVTTKDLKTGDIIAIEDPVFTWPNPSIPDPACLNCAKTNSGSLIPCEHCTAVMFCSEECQEKVSLFHLNDNKAYTGKFQTSLKMIFEAFRIAGGVNELLELLKDCNGKTIFDFDFSKPDDPYYEKNKLIALNGLCKDAECGEIVAGVLNIPPINEKKRTPKECKQLTKFVKNQRKIFCSNLTRFRHDHDGILLLKSLLNHSCLPNVDCEKVDGKSVLFVICPVKAGEQLFCSYGAQATSHIKRQRQTILQSFQFKFKCDCEACTYDYRLPFPRKDRSFVEPQYAEFAPAEAIEQFKKNCKYIDENAGKMPCYEVPRLIAHNNFLTHCIAGKKI